MKCSESGVLFWGLGWWFGHESAKFLFSPCSMHAWCIARKMLVLLCVLGALSSVSGVGVDFYYRAILKCRGGCIENSLFRGFTTERCPQFNSQLLLCMAHHMQCCQKYLCMHFVFGRTHCQPLFHSLSVCLAGWWSWFPGGWVDGSQSGTPWWCGGSGSTGGGQQGQQLVLLVCAMLCVNFHL